MIEQESDTTASDDASEVIDVASHQRKVRGRKPLPEHLPRIEVIHDLDEADKVCVTDGHALHKIGEEVSEQLEIVPAKFRVIRNIRIKYGCRACETGVKTAPLPAQLIPKSMATASLLSYIAISKYADALPLYRQEQMFKRIGVELSRATLAFWMIQVGKALGPIIALLEEALLEGSVIHMDETPVQVLKEPGRKAQSQSYMWVQRGGPPDKPIILFDYAPTRSQEVPVELLSDYAGYLQIDGYEGYNKVIANNDIIPLGCMAHVRRKFDEALKTQGKLKNRQVSLAQQAMLRIQLLYKIERKAKSLSDEQRCELRQSKAVPVLKGLREWLDQHLPVVVKQSALGKAMHYMDKQWPRLSVYTQDGRLNIDNNLCENAIRPFVIGRKNSLFSDTVSGAKASSNLYSLIETAKANGLEPYTYLKKVFTELPKASCIEDIEALLPFQPQSEEENAA